MDVEVEAVILDMDGTMLDTEPLYKVAWQAASEELGYPLDDVAYAQRVGRQTGDCERESVEQLRARAVGETQLVEVADVTHNDLYIEPELYTTLEQFLNS